MARVPSREAPPVSDSPECTRVPAGEPLHQWVRNTPRRHHRRTGRQLIPSPRADRRADAGRRGL